MSNTLPTNGLASRSAANHLRGSAGRGVCPMEAEKSNLCKFEVLGAPISTWVANSVAPKGGSRVSWRELASQPVNCPTDLEPSVLLVFPYPVIVRALRIGLDAELRLGVVFGANVNPCLPGRPDDTKRVAVPD